MNICKNLKSKNGGCGWLVIVKYFNWDPREDAVQGINDVKNFKTKKLKSRMIVLWLCVGINRVWVAEWLKASIC